MQTSNKIDLVNPVRRQLIVSLVLAAPALSTRAAAEQVMIEVWKDPSCGCCKDWVKHLQANGFKVKINDSGNTEARARLGMPIQYAACHTGEVGGYAIEGHVPAREIRRLLKERPTAVGLSVPGMPRGAPGMDDPAYGQERDHYDVFLVHQDGSVRVYQSYH